MKKRSATGGEMPFTVHLGELRGRLIRSLVAMGVAFCICYTFSERLLYFLWLPAGRELVFIAPTEAFFAHLKVSFLASLVLVWPYL
ncbi:MAG: twin-arginine translocase subunit TatC, partial [bacterium]|nr:twin-arginine translocase subunit TatC [bacterium]